MKSMKIKGTYQIRHYKPEVKDGFFQISHLVAESDDLPSLNPLWDAEYAGKPIMQSSSLKKTVRFGQ